MFVALALLICSCNSNERPLTRDEIFQQRIEVETLYLTADGQEIVAAGNKDGVIVYPQTNQLAWAAFQCGNPACPGEGENDRPYLFIWPNPLAEVNAEGDIGFRLVKTEDDIQALHQYAEVACPACLKIRNLTRETPQQKRQYKQWCHPYVLPQAAKRLEQLDEQHRRFLERQKQREQQRESKR